MNDYPLFPGHKARDTETSQEAAESVGDCALIIRSRVRRFFETVDNATADEAAHALGLSILVVRPRCSELKARGVLVDSGQRRPNDSGKSAVAWQHYSGRAPVKGESNEH